MEEGGDGKEVRGWVSFFHFKGVINVDLLRLFVVERKFFSYIYFFHALSMNLLLAPFF